MKNALFVIFMAISSFTLAQKIDFDTYFQDKVLRFDYLHAGNANISTYYFLQLKEQPFYGGTKTNLIDTFNFGEYRFLIFDSASNLLIYSRGFGTLFNEWQTTPEAQVLNKSFNEVLILPYPKKTIKLVIQERDKKLVFQQKFQMYINPENYFINADILPAYKVNKTVNNGDPSKMVDLVFLSEGYAASEMKKFNTDVAKFVETLFSYEPYKKMQKKFNIWAVEVPSVQSGTDIPGDNVWKNTAFNSTFYTFDSERYLTTSYLNLVHDAAACVPFDQIFILVNTSKYGGGGIYNYYNVTVSDHAAAQQVFIHELGHGFAALADEYYTSDVAYENYFDLNVEPFQANITTLVNFDSKWKNLLDKNTPIPTPDTPEFSGKTGVFEGGGYNAKGIYRPMQNCLMKSFSTNAFCPVCTETIKKMIRFYTE